MSLFSWDNILLIPTPQASLLNSYSLLKFEKAKIEAMSLIPN